MPIDTRTALLRVRWMLAAEDVLKRLAVLREACKANFNPSQPRVPAGSREGGRWADTGINDPRVLSDAVDLDVWTPGAQLAQNTPPGGHHFVPRGVFGKMPLAPETSRVLEGARTGPLAAGIHRWSAEHNIYNQAVTEYFEQF